MIVGLRTTFLMSAFEIVLEIIELLPSLEHYFAHSLTCRKLTAVARLLSPLVNLIHLERQLNVEYLALYFGKYLKRVPFLWLTLTTDSAMSLIY